MSTIEDLEAQLKTAREAADAYSAEITAKYRSEIPPEVDEKGKELPVTPELTVKRARAWTEAEHAELDRLRGIARNLAVELHRARQQAPGHLHGD